MKFRDLAKPERLLVGGILGVLLIAAIGVPMIAGGKVDKPQQSFRYQPDKEDDPDVIAPDLAGPPNQEVGLDFYKSLTKDATEYPQIRPLILNDMANDGMITYAEMAQIIKAEQPMVIAKGRKEWDAEAKPYRQALKKAAS